jgi:uncharacterized membrane protein YjgN (DUF898 family)
MDAVVDPSIRRSLVTSNGAADVTLAFSGTRSDFAKLLVRGSALVVATFTFYRFWLVTDIRRHLWSNTRLGEESLEYVGTGRELLLGFLLALAVLAPVYIVYAVLGIVAETAQAFASVPLGAFFYAFTRYAAYRGRRYRASRTVFRGVRFWMAGSPWSYAGRTLVWDLGTVLTLGLLLPWRLAALERYAMKHTRFGDLEGEFTSTGGTLFRRGWPLWAVCAVIVLIAAVRPFGPFSVLAVLALPIIIPLFFGIRWRWQVEGIRFGQVSLSSSLEPGDLWAPILKFSAAILGYLLLGGGILAALGYTTGATGPNAITWTTGTVATGALLAVLYLAFLVGVGALKRYFLDRGIWKKLVETTSLRGVASLEAVLAQGKPASSLGEGLADALDVGF